MTTNHTKTPWRKRKPWHAHIDGDHVVVENCDDRVLMDHIWIQNGDMKMVSDMLAAVNAQAGLVAACQRFVNTDACDCDPADARLGVRSCPWCEGVAALAKAGEA